jgi:hypothetical protein
MNNAALIAALVACFALAIGLIQMLARMIEGRRRPN